jgi:hypothetical protein
MSATTSAAFERAASSSLLFETTGLTSFFDSLGFCFWLCVVARRLFDVMMQAARATTREADAGVIILVSLLSPGLEKTPLGEDLFLFVESAQG